MPKTLRILEHSKSVTVCVFFLFACVFCFFFPEDCEISRKVFPHFWTKSERFEVMSRPSGFGSAAQTDCGAETRRSPPEGRVNDTSLWAKRIYICVKCTYFIYISRFRDIQVSFPDIQVPVLLLTRLWNSCSLPLVFFLLNLCDTCSASFGCQIWNSNWQHVTFDCISIFNLAPLVAGCAEDSLDGVVRCLFLRMWGPHAPWINELSTKKQSQKIKLWKAEDSWIETSCFEALAHDSPCKTPQLQTWVLHAV